MGLCVSYYVSMDSSKAEKSFAQEYASASRDARHGNHDSAFQRALRVVGLQLRGPIGELASVDDVTGGDLACIVGRDVDMGYVLGVVEEVNNTGIKIAGQQIPKIHIMDVYLVGFGYPVVSIESGADEEPDRSSHESTGIQEI